MQSRGSSGSKSTNGAANFCTRAGFRRGSVRMILGWTVGSFARRASCALSAAARRSCSFRDRKSTRLNSSHGYISYAVFCLKKKSKLLRACHLVVLQVSFFPNREGYDKRLKKRNIILLTSLNGRVYWEHHVLNFSHSETAL